MYLMFMIPWLTVAYSVKPNGERKRSTMRVIGVLDVHDPVANRGDGLNSCGWI